MSRKVAAGVILSITAGLIIIGGAYLWFPAFRWGPVKPYAGPVEKITLATLPIYTAGLLFIAQEKGFFGDNGLEVAVKSFQTGQTGMDRLKAGQVDIASASDFVLVDAIFKGGTSLRCLGSIATADINHLMARKDRGILQPGDLKGRRVGVSRGTIAEFFLGSFLTFNNLSLRDVKLIYLAPGEMPAALANDQVDAVMVWDPVTYDLEKRLGERIISWPGQSSQKFYFVLVCTDEFIRARPGVPERLVRALAQAETFIKHHQDESLAIIANRINLDQSIFKSDWLHSDYELAFDQSLVIAMEDEARWMMRHKLTEQTRLPDFLDYFYVAPLAKVVPQKVQIIIPPGGNGSGTDLSGTGPGR